MNLNDSCALIKLSNNFESVNTLNSNNSQIIFDQNNLHSEHEDINNILPGN